MDGMGESQQKWGKNAFGVSFLGEGRIIWQCQNYHIKLSMWTLVTMSYTKEILGGVFKCSLTSFPQSPPRGGVDFRQNCNTEISGVNVSVQKKIPLILVHFITYSVLKILIFFLEWKLRKLFKLEAKLNRL